MNQEIREKIAQWHICVVYRPEGERKVGARIEKKSEMKEAEAYLTAHKQEILAELDEMAEEKRLAEEEEAKHKHKFYCFGWECHTIIIDDREDLERQFNNYGNNDDLSPEYVKKAYYEQLAKEAAKVQKKEEEKKELEESPFEIVKSKKSKFENGECGYDYEAYATIREKETGEEVEFKEMNIFDFGRVSCPARFVGKHEAAHPETWTELERQMDAWFVKHSIVGTDMRM